jgi:hypothetical protein
VEIYEDGVRQNVRVFQSVRGAADGPSQRPISEQRTTRWIEQERRTHKSAEFDAATQLCFCRLRRHRASES